MIFDQTVFVDKWYAVTYFDIVLKRSLSALHRPVVLISNVNQQTKSKAFFGSPSITNNIFGMLFY